jgi:hypothetical protein
MKSQTQTIPMTNSLPNFARVIRGIKSSIAAKAMTLLKPSQEDIEKALADAVIEKHYQETRHKALEYSLGFRPDTWKGL